MRKCLAMSLCNITWPFYSSKGVPYWAKKCHSNLQQKPCFIYISLVATCCIPFFIGPRYTWCPIYGSKSLSVREWCLVDLTDVTLVDEDTNSILADDTNTIPGNLETQVRQSYLVISTKFQIIDQISESQPNFRQYFLLTHQM